MDAETTELLISLWRAGLVQLGSFGDSPLQTRLELLPSYPTLMRAAADLLIAALAPLRLQRLLATSDAAPLAGILSVELGLPLVIHTGVFGAPVQNVIGAYDVGHPTALVCLTPPADHARLVREAEQVGLRITASISVFVTSPLSPPKYALCRLEHLISELMARDLAPKPLLEHIRKWNQDGQS